MAPMVRKQVYIGQEQDTLLKRQAHELGVTESRLIREGIDRVAAVPPAHPLDRRPWEAELAFLRARASLPAPHGG